MSKFSDALLSICLRQYLVFLAGWSRWLDQLLKNAQAHEGDVFNNHWSLNVHCHQKEAES